MSTLNKWQRFTQANKRAKSSKGQFNAKIDEQVLESFRSCCAANGIEMQAVVEQAMREFVEQMVQPGLSLAPLPITRDD